MIKITKEIMAIGADMRRYLRAEPYGLSLTTLITRKSVENTLRLIFKWRSAI